MVQRPDNPCLLPAPPVSPLILAVLLLLGACNGETGKREPEAGVAQAIPAPPGDGNGDEPEAGTGNGPKVDTAGVPGRMDAGDTVRVPILSDAQVLAGDILQASAGVFIEVRVDGGELQLTAMDVPEVLQESVRIAVSNQAGRRSEEVVPIELLPVSADGSGHTLFGSREGRGVHLVMLGDGYRSSEQALLRAHALRVLEAMRADEGIAQHIDAFNIHYVETVSVDSGADDLPDTDVRDTAFNSHYGCAGVERVICADTLALFEAALDRYPNLNQLVLLVNDRRFGGSGNTGGSLAIASAYSPGLVLHEMGHSLAKLGDEYVDQSVMLSRLPETPGLRSYANLSITADPAKVPWAHWIDTGQPLVSQPGEPGIGVFEGGLYVSSGVFRPSDRSRMADHTRAFGKVNSEAWVLSLYQSTGGVRGFAPVSNRVEAVPGSEIRFSVTPFFGPTVQAVSWRLDGEIVAATGHSELSLSMPAGEHVLELTVQDISGVLREPALVASRFRWSWQLVGI